MPTVRRPAPALLFGLALVVAAALTPAGLSGRPVAPWSWGVWAGVFAAALWTFGRAGLPMPEAFRRVGWLVPVVALFSVPAALLAPSGERLVVGAALAARALSAAAMGAAVATLLGPSGLVRAARDLRQPARRRASASGSPARRNVQSAATKTAAHTAHDHEGIGWPLKPAGESAADTTSARPASSTDAGRLPMGIMTRLPHAAAHAPGDQGGKDGAGKPRGSRRDRG